MTTKELITKEDGSQVMRFTDVHDVPIDIYTEGLLQRQAEQVDVQDELDSLQTKGVDVATMKAELSTGQTAKIML